MVVEEIMKKKVITLFTHNTISDAIFLMDTKKIRHLPIVDQEQRLVGLISDRDIRDAAPSIFYTDEHREVLEKPLHTIMKTNLITAHPLDFVEELAAVFYEHRIGCLPIVSNDKLVGIITETDMLRTLVELTGAHQPGSMISVKAVNIESVLSDVTTIIKRRNCHIQSVLVYPDKEDDQSKNLVIRIQTINPKNIVEDLKKEGLDIRWPNSSGISL